MRPAPLRVLVVDDNHVNRVVAQGSLASLGYESSLASSGHEALMKLEQEPFDLILLDWQMSDLDGFKVASMIRASSKPVASTVIVAYTANAFQGDRELCLKAGMNDYLCKPCTLSEMKRMLEKWERRISIPSLAEQLASLNVFDPDEMREKYRGFDGVEGGDHAILLSYLTSCSTLIEKLEKSVHESDRKEALMQLHSIRSSSGNVGTYRVRWTANAFERAIRSFSGSLSEVDLTAKLKEEFVLASEKIRAMIELERPAKP